MHVAYRYIYEYNQFSYLPILQKKLQNINIKLIFHLIKFHHILSIHKSNNVKYDSEYNILIV